MSQNPGGPGRFEASLAGGVRRHPVGSVGQFSVLMPVYRGDTAAFVRRAFRSVTLEQKLRPEEVVIVRDGPVDLELDRLLDSFVEAVPGTRVRLVRFAEGRGLARVLDEGLSCVSHEIVARMDADDVSLPGRFFTQVPMIEDGLDLVGSAIFEFEHNEFARGRVRVMPTTQGQIEREARFSSPFSHPSVVYRKSAVRRAGGYAELDHMEDYLLWARMIMSGAKMANVAEPLLSYRVGSGAYSRRGGLALLRAEISLQRIFRDDHFTTQGQYVRNVIVRGLYRLVPQVLRKALYRQRLAVRAGIEPAYQDAI